MKQRNVRDKRHLKFIRSLPCCRTGLQDHIEAAHVRAGTDGGIGLKPSDFWTIPLHFSEHHKQHSLGEKTYWGDLERVRGLAKALWEVTGDRDKGILLVSQFRRGN